MAWTTSASLRVRPVLWEVAASQMKYAAVLVRSFLRSLQHWHPSFALALPLAALGLISPLLPYGLLAGLLLTTGAAVAALSIPSARTRSAPSGARQELADPPPGCADQQMATGRATLLSSEITLQRHAQRLAEITSTASRIRSAAEENDNSWAELMARVNHELRTPLNAVIGFSDMMSLKLFGPVGDPRYEDYIRHIRDSANELLKSAED
ncbi:MAG: histidine kinase dimerization/phospho-acceptor domain-containing protein, partial [Hyphomicrobium sp.]